MEHIWILDIWGEGKDVYYFKKYFLSFLGHIWLPSKPSKNADWSRLSAFKKPQEITVESFPTETSERSCLKDKVSTPLSKNSSVLPLILRVTVVLDVWLVLHQRRTQKAWAKENLLKRSYKIISLCKSIKITLAPLSMERLKEGAEVAELWCACFNEIPLLLRSTLPIFHISAWERFDAFLPVPRVNWKHFRRNLAWRPMLPCLSYSSQ